MEHAPETMEVFRSGVTLADGMLNPSEAPGLGVEYDEKAAARFPYDPRTCPLPGPRRLRPRLVTTSRLDTPRHPRVDGRPWAPHPRAPTRTPCAASFRPRGAKEHTMTHDKPTAAEARTVTRTTSDLKRAAVSGWLGTAMEFMDFQLYSLAAAIVFNEIFFPDVSPAIGLIAAMAHLRRRLRRAASSAPCTSAGWATGSAASKVLFITIALMGAVDHPHRRPAHLRADRHRGPDPARRPAARPGLRRRRRDRRRDDDARRVRPPKRRGVIASLVSLGTNSGTLAATGLWAILLAVLSEEQLLSWGWRLPFLLSFFLMIFAVWIRRQPQGEPGLRGPRRRRRRRRGPQPGGARPPQAATSEDEERPGRALKQRKGKAFFIALGLRFGQAGNSGLIQTFLVGFLATTLLLDRSIATNALLIGSAVGFATVPLVGLISDRVGRRPVYMALTVISGILAFPLMHLIAQGHTVAVTISMILLHNLAVLGLFSLESVTMAELFGARTRFTQLALAKEIGGILATAIGPLLAATLTAATGSGGPSPRCSSRTRASR